MAGSSSTSAGLSLAEYQDDLDDTNCVDEVENEIGQP